MKIINAAQNRRAASDYSYLAAETLDSCLGVFSISELECVDDRIARIRSSPSSALLPAFIKLNISVMKRPEPMPNKEKKSNHFPIACIIHIFITSYE